MNATLPTTRVEFGAWLAATGRTGAAVEVGVQRGLNAAQWLATWPGTLHLVDPWMAQGPDYRDIANVSDAAHEKNLRETRRRVAPFGDRAQIVRRTSLAAAPLFADGSLDAVYLDGRHDEPHVSRDLAAWWPKVRAGGVLAGHDYFDAHLVGGVMEVKGAVDTFAAARGLSVHVTDELDPSWILEKPEDG